MVYQYIGNEKISKGDYKTALLLSDGKRWFNLLFNIVKNIYKFVKFGEIYLFKKLRWVRL